MTLRSFVLYQLFHGSSYAMKEDWSTRIISVMPCTLKSMEKEHFRIEVEGLGEKTNLASLRILAGQECVYQESRKQHKGRRQGEPEEP